MIDYAKALNPAQLQAATVAEGNTLVVAGAGTGKTRTIVYRLAWLTGQGVPPEEILLLTFTRKAAKEMLTRAEGLAGQTLGRLPGGTFHSFAYGCLRMHRPEWLEGRSFTLMDPADINQAIKECRENLKLGKKDSSFPNTPAIAGLLSKARNKELPLEELLRREGPHLLPHAGAIEEIGKAYNAFRRSHALMDYDDLLFEMEELLKADGPAAADLRRRFSHILVDEYQDTNLVQARIVRQLAKPGGQGLTAPSIMAVGDEAQSIYAFRGANVQNILDFPKLFPPARIIRLEQNYRSTQPVLDVANGILEHAAQSFRKSLFTVSEGGGLPALIRPLSDISEAALVTQRILELLETQRPHEIAVLFRAGYHSYALEANLRKAGIAFRKYGGLRFEEAAHIKDVLAFARLALNPMDSMAFARIACMHKGIGPRTQAKLHAVLAANRPEEIKKAFRRCQDFWADLEFIAAMRDTISNPQKFFVNVLERYRPRLEDLHPEDWPSRLPGLEEVLTLAQGYDSLDLFMADLTLENPEEEADPEAENCITLSTIHSAKGLEWRSVLILDAVEDRFPSRHAQVRPEDFEEERRLFYVACTRAKKTLDIYAPAALFSRGSATMARQSPFLQELSPALFCNMAERPHNGGLQQLTQPRLRAQQTMPNNGAEYGEEDPSPKDLTRSGIFPPQQPAFPLARGAGHGNLPESGYCRHRVFGRGKIIRHLGDDRIQVEFPGFGMKIILCDYLVPEE